jgi:hypothetical protein
MLEHEPNQIIMSKKGPKRSDNKKIKKKEK